MLPVDFLMNLPLFQGLTPDQVAQLQPLFTPCEYSVDTTIFQQGEPAEHLYVVLTGEVVVMFKPEDGPALIVGRVQPGGVVGWSAALRSRNYTSAALTCEETRLLRVSGADLRSICEQQPNIGQTLLDQLAGIIAERLRSTHPQVLELLRLGLGNPLQHQEVK
jgi:CRP-like cAMP-binding protein